MAAATTDIDTHLGRRIHALRTSQQLTLEALAQRAEVSRAMLSRIERGDSSPTAQLLVKICGGLGISLSSLFVDNPATPSPLTRYAAQPVWRDPATGYVRRNVSPAHAGLGVDIVEVEFPPGARVVFENRQVAAADQQIWVLQGRLDLTVGEETFALETGDCLRMRFGLSTTFHNPTQTGTRYAVILGQSMGAA